MTVRIIESAPDPSVVKRVVCRNCGCKLEYVPADVKKKKDYDYTGDFDIVSYIDCPNCKTNVTVG